MKRGGGKVFLKSDVRMRALSDASAVASPLTLEDIMLLIIRFEKGWRTACKVGKQWEGQWRKRIKALSVPSEREDLSAFHLKGCLIERE